MDEWKARVDAATVCLPDTGAQGVLVPGGFILTASHCIEWASDGRMTLGDAALVTVQPSEGDSFRGQVYAVEPVADIAVLGPPDNQQLPDDAQAFEAFCETPPVDVSVDNFELEVPVHVLVRTHRGTWTEAEAVRCGWGALGACVWVKANAKVECGSSGGPIIDAAGQLVGVVSWSSEDSFDGMAPRPHLALPRWAWMRIEAAMRAAHEPPSRSPKKG